MKNVNEAIGTSVYFLMVIHNIIYPSSSSKMWNKLFGINSVFQTIPFVSIRESVKDGTFNKILILSKNKYIITRLWKRMKR